MLLLVRRWSSRVIFISYRVKCTVIRAAGHAIDEVGVVLVLFLQLAILAVVWPANKHWQMPSFFQAHPWPLPNLILSERRALVTCGYFFFFFFCYGL